MRQFIFTIVLTTMSFRAGFSEESPLIGEFNPETLEITEYDSPVSGPRRMHFNNAGILWLNENMTDRLYRFIPAEERFIVYTVPLSGTCTRDMTFTSDSRVCTSNNTMLTRWEATSTPTKSSTNTRGRR